MMPGEYGPTGEGSAADVTRVSEVSEAMPADGKAATCNVQRSECDVRCNVRRAMCDRSLRDAPYRPLAPRWRHVVTFPRELIII